MHKYAIIVAGGKGERMGAKTPKQFLELAGKPILMHTLEKFKETIPNIEIILALPENQIDFWQGLFHEYKVPKVKHQIVKGGETRFHSVQNALKLVKENSIVAIHDGVRPLVSKQTIETCFAEAEKKGNAIPVVEVVDSLRHYSKQDKTNEAVSRTCYKIVQTPQCFTSELILKAYKQDFDKLFTDDATVVERLGETINLVKGNRSNIKITTAEDILVAEASMK
ncbi:MAG: 2-C-methyl-D-erythritol 4-phosphate cytidylyltransferase [Flavobacteriales bacterium]|nr:MAG: 2-C-methyl-D-erythritol 4-phosphate cytidylyltransferase [Flavobacteriales bacterium]